MPAPLDTYDPAIQSENIGYSADALITCGKCSRSNAPNRLECMYCGATLNVDPRTLEKVTARVLEAWEPGTSIVITGGDGDAERASHLLSIERDQLAEILRSAVPLPLARMEAGSAELVAKKIEALGYTTRLIDDSDLELKRPPVRIAAMSIRPDTLTLIGLNTRDGHTVSWDELRLIVKGTFSSGKIDSFEKRRLRSTTVMSETVTSADEPVLDLYAGEDKNGFRVQLSGFDYSCLGEKMAPLANENMSRLQAMLVARSPGAKVLEYTPIRHLLTGIWDIESRKDPKGLVQTGVGKREFGVVHSTSNVEQFTRFSRLQRLML